LLKKWSAALAHQMLGVQKGGHPNETVDFLAGIYQKITWATAFEKKCVGLCATH
jgi:hypothetical protein